MKIKKKILVWVLMSAIVLNGCGVGRVFDEDDHDTGEKQILPGLKVMERRGFITIDVQEEKKAEAPKADAQKEEAAAEVKKPAARKRTTKKTAQ